MGRNTRKRDRDSNNNRDRDGHRDRDKDRYRELKNKHRKDDSYSYNHSHSESSDDGYYGNYSNYNKMVVYPPLPIEYLEYMEQYSRKYAECQINPIAFHAKIKNSNITENEKKEGYAAYTAAVSAYQAYIKQTNCIRNDSQDILLPKMKGDTTTAVIPAVSKNTTNVISSVGVGDNSESNVKSEGSLVLSVFLCGVFSFMWL